MWPSHLWYFSMLSLLCSALLGLSTAADIKIGQTADFSGINAEMGRQMQLGIRAAFNQVNNWGGVRGGDTLTLISLDDAYDPVLAVANTHTLAGVDKVFCLLGCVGTQTSDAIVPVIKSYDIPFVGPFTGSMSLRAPFDPIVVNLRVSFFSFNDLTQSPGFLRGRS